ncbi:MAG: adenosine deaminase [Saprospirales bacterium]|nr:adenosine deaminase [Saprospirales bacterium]
MSLSPIDKFIEGMPKAELHLHIEGTFEPEMMFQIAKRNGRILPYRSVEDLKDAYRFNNLQEFLNIYYTGAELLIEELDFYELTYAYLERVHAQNVVHVEVFFDPQTHTDRGVSFDTVIKGIHRALEDGQQKLGITFKMIMCFLRHLPEESAFKTLEQALPYKHMISGVGLDSSELGNPPSKFKNVFEKARKEGFLALAHAGEEGPAEYIWEALDLLHVVRIDHGNRCLDDQKLVKELAKRKIPLTLCPLSNVALKVVKDLSQYPIIEMTRRGLLITVNSDDPAYFGGYLNENFFALAKALFLSKTDLARLAKNSFQASFLEESEKKKWIAKVEEYYSANNS